MPTATAKAQLSRRDLAMIRDVGRYKFLTSHQIERTHYADMRHRTLTDSARQLLSRRTSATQRLSQLATLGFLSRVFSFPSATANPKGGHPTAIYYLAPDNLTTLQRYLEVKGRADEYDAYHHLAATDNHDAQFSQLYLVHELGISDFFLALEAACATHGWILPFWERTSPFSSAIQETLTVTITRKGKITTERRSFNPDSFFALQDPDGTLSFYFLEYDNNTSTPDKFRRKLDAYAAYHAQKKFPALLHQYAATYTLPIPPRDTHGFRVLTLTPTERRRNHLYLDSLKLKKYTQFLFASMTDITPATVLTSVWLRGKEFPDLQRHLDHLSPATSPMLQSRLINDAITTHHPRVSLTT